MFWSNEFPTKGQNILVSGGSQGAGLELAKLLVKKGSNVIILSRSESKLQTAVTQINKNNKDSLIVDYVACDLTEYQECERAFTETTEKFKGNLPDAIFCCVGSSVPKLFVDLSPKDLEMGIKTNYNTALYLSHVALQHYSKAVERKPRHLVFFSSVLAHFTFIGYSQYSPLKAALKNLCDSLKDEAKIYKVKVTCAYPGNFMSEGFLEEQQTKPEITKMIEGPSDAIPPEKVCEKILNQLNNGTEVITTDFVGYILSSMALRTQFSWDGIFQFFFCVILQLISPIAHLVIGKQVQDFFKKQEKLNVVDDVDLKKD